MCGQIVVIPAGSSSLNPFPGQFSPPGSTPPAKSDGGGSGRSLVPIVLAVVGLVVLVMCGGVLALIIPAFSAARQAAVRTKSANNLKMIGLAMHNYHDVFASLPLAGSEDPQFGIGLSWRVRVLPFLEQPQLYDRVKWNEPWDGPNNRALVEQMPQVYQSPAEPPSTSRTVYLAVADAEVVPRDRPLPSSGPRPIFSHDGRAARFASIVDGTSNTVMVVEANGDQAVTWTQPKDWTFDPQQPRRGLGKPGGPGFQVLMADGSVRLIAKDVGDEVVRRMMWRDDGKPLPPGSR